MERTQFDWQHQYLATPWEYPISANENHSTYDQFIQLRDTLIFTWKYYNDKASRKLCVGDKWDWTTTNTIEVWLPNIFRQGFQPTWRADENKPWILGNYVTWIKDTIEPSQLSSWWPLCCQIQKDGRYRIMHKEEILLTSSINKVFCYVDIYKKNWNTWSIPSNRRWWVVVFDWEWNTSLTTSWTDPNWTVAITLWKLFKKMTASWQMEMDLEKGDILVLRMKDWPHNPSTWEPTGNDLPLQQDSNYWSIEYLDLPYNI